MWKELEYLDRVNLEKIQERRDEIIIRHYVGEMPRKIVSCYSCEKIIYMNDVVIGHQFLL